LACERPGHCRKSRRRPRGHPRQVQREGCREEPVRQAGEAVHRHLRRPAIAKEGVTRRPHLAGWYRRRRAGRRKGRHPGHRRLHRRPRRRLGRAHRCGQLRPTRAAGRRLPQLPRARRRHRAALARGVAARQSPASVADLPGDCRSAGRPARPRRFARLHHWHPDPPSGPADPGLFRQPARHGHRLVARGRVLVHSFGVCRARPRLGRAALDRVARRPGARLQLAAARYRRGLRQGRRRCKVCEGLCRRVEKGHGAGPLRPAPL
ncbi:hypothetical protein HK405_013158, partial [Cladochytrium tenue]